MAFTMASSVASAVALVSDDRIVARADEPAGALASRLPDRYISTMTTPSGRRFVMVQPKDSDRPESFHVGVSWLSELTERNPAR
jgi:hypothetical protein